jgi:hypothetical protein
MLFMVDLIYDPSPDGGVNVLRDFFARSDTTLTKVTFSDCAFRHPDALQLLAAFHTNRTVTDITIHEMKKLQGGAALGNALAGLTQNMPQLQRLDCSSLFFTIWVRKESVPFSQHCEPIER